MGQAQIVVNNRHYEVSCGDGEEARLRELGATLDQRVRRLAASIGQVGEVRLLLLTCLLLEDELSEAAARPPQSPPQPLAYPPAQPPTGTGRDGGPPLPAGLGADLDGFVRRIEAVAARLKQP